MDSLIRNTSFPTKLRFDELDFISDGISVNVAGQDRIKSKTGAIISIILYTLLGCSIYYYLRKFLMTTEPKIQFNRSIQAQSYKYNLTETKLYFFLLIQNPEGTSTSKFQNESFFENNEFNNGFSESSLTGLDSNDNPCNPNDPANYPDCTEVPPDPPG